MITVDVDYGHVIEGLDNIPAGVLRALEHKIAELTVDLQGYVVSRKLQGQVLNHKSGALSNSIQASDAKVVGTQITGDVFSSSDVKYAGIHEFGGVIPGHDIVAKNAKALAFMIDGKQVFARKVHIPDVKMPERSFLRSSLTENKERIVAGISDAALKAAKEALNQ
jgi:phage gpG-like protein